MRGFMSSLKNGRVAIAALGLLTAFAATTAAGPARADWDDHRRGERHENRGWDRDDRWRREEWREHHWREPVVRYYYDPGYVYYPPYEYRPPAYAYPQPGVTFGFNFR